MSHLVFGDSGLCLQTLYCGNMVGDQMVQVTSAGVRLLAAQTGALQDCWLPPSGLQINIASASPSQVYPCPAVPCPALPCGQHGPSIQQVWLTPLAAAVVGGNWSREHCLSGGGGWQAEAGGPPQAGS